MDTKPHILLVEDDESMGFLLKDSLEGHGFNVTHCVDGSSAIFEFKRATFNLCLLDVMMPNMDGFTLAEKIRKSDHHIPIIFLTAKAMKEDKIKGFKIGADDYVTKPFNIEELVLRMIAVLKRGQLIRQEEKGISFGSFYLDLNNLTLDNGLQKTQLTQKETDILALFSSNKNVLLKREFILKSVWQDDSYFVGRSLDVFISKLRKHFKAFPQIEIINIHGTGYKFQVAE